MITPPITHHIATLLSIAILVVRTEYHESPMLTKITINTHISPRLFDQIVYKSETTSSRHLQNFSIFHVNVTPLCTDEIYLLSHDSTIIYTSDMPPKHHLKHVHLPPIFIKTSIDLTTTIYPNPLILYRT